MRYTIYQKINIKSTNAHDNCKMQSECINMKMAAAHSTSEICCECLNRWSRECSHPGMWLSGDKATIKMINV